MSIGVAAKKMSSQTAAETRRIVVGLILCALGGYALISFVSLFPLPAG